MRILLLLALLSCACAAGYNCSCAPGYTGLQCQTDIDECVSSPCQNGGTCMDGVNGYTCTCVADYHGTHCESIYAISMDSTNVLNSGTSTTMQAVAFNNASTTRQTITSLAFAVDVLWNTTSTSGGALQFVLNNAVNPFLRNVGNGANVALYAAFRPSTTVANAIDAALVRIGGSNVFSAQTAGYAEPVNPRFTRLGFYMFCPNPGASSCFYNVTIFVGNRTTSFLHGTSRTYPLPMTHAWCMGMCIVNIYPSTRHSLFNFALQYNGTETDALALYNGDLSKATTYIPFQGDYPNPPTAYGPYEMSSEFYSTSAAVPGWVNLTSPLPPTRDYCQYSPCRNGGTCFQTSSRFTCTCASGWTDGLCRTNVNECLSNPCQNGGTCTDGINGYTCACAAAYIGSQCQTLKGYYCSGAYWSDDTLTYPLDIAFTTDGNFAPAVPLSSSSGATFFIRNRYPTDHGLNSITTQIWSSDGSTISLSVSDTTTAEASYFMVGDAETVYCAVTLPDMGIDGWHSIAFLLTSSGALIYYDTELLTVPCFPSGTSAVFLDIVEVMQFYDADDLRIYNRTLTQTEIYTLTYDLVEPDDRPLVWMPFTNEQLTNNGTYSTPIFPYNQPTFATCTP
jgi:hypothetical protein